MRRSATFAALAVMLAACFEDPPPVETGGPESSSGGGIEPRCEPIDDACNRCSCDETLAGECAAGPVCQNCVQAEACAAALACVYTGELNCCVGLSVEAKTALAACRMCAHQNCADHCGGDLPEMCG